LGRIETQRCFAVPIPFAIGICYASGDSCNDSVSFAACVHFTASFCLNASSRLAGRITCCFSGSCSFYDPGSIRFSGSFSYQRDFCSFALAFGFRT